MNCRSEHKCYKKMEKFTWLNQEDDEDSSGK